MSNEAKKIGKNAALALLSQVPVVSAFSKFFEDFVQDNWQERIDLWKEQIIARLAQLDSEVEQKIRETANFANILASAQRGALEDIEEDKVVLYANAVINAIANGESPVLMFTGVIEGRNGSQERVTYRECILSGDSDIQNVATGDVLKRSFALHCNGKVENKSKLTI